MLKTERILAIFFLLAIGVNFFLGEIVGASLFIVLSTSMLSFIYLVFGFAVLNNIGFKSMFKKVSYADIKPLRLLGTVFIGFALSTIINGMLFRLMNWLGGQVILVVAILAVLICLVIAIVKYNRLKSDFYAYLILRLSFFGIIALLMFFIPKENLGSNEVDRIEIGSPYD